MLLLCWLALASARMMGVGLVEALALDDIPQHTVHHSDYAPWYQRISFSDGSVVGEQVREMNLDRSLDLFQNLEQMLNNDNRADLSRLLDGSSEWRYMSLRDKTKVIPNVILMEWADVLLELLRKEQTSLKIAKKEITQLQSENEDLLHLAMSQRSPTSSGQTSSSSFRGNPLQEENLLKVLGEIGSAANSEYNAVSPGKLVSKVESVFGFAKTAYETITSVRKTLSNSEAPFPADFDSYLNGTTDLEQIQCDLTAFKDEVISTLSAPKEEEHSEDRRPLFVQGLLIEKDELEKKLSDAQQQLSEIAMETSVLKQDRSDVIEAVSPFVKILDSSPLLPAAKILIDAIHFRDNLVKSEGDAHRRVNAILTEKITSLIELNKEVYRELDDVKKSFELGELKFIALKEAFVGLHKTSLELKEEIDRLQAQNSSLKLNMTEDMKKLVEENSVLKSALEQFKLLIEKQEQKEESGIKKEESDTQLKKLEEFKELLALKQKEHEELQALFKELQTKEKLQSKATTKVSLIAVKPAVHYSYTSSSSSTSSSTKSKSTAEPTKQPATITPLIYTEADMQRLMLAERAKIPERCRVVSTANYAMLGSSLTLFAAGSGLIGYWYYMLRPVLAVI